MRSSPARQVVHHRHHASPRASSGEHSRGVRRQLLDLVARSGVVTRSQALAAVPRHVLYDAVADGCLERVFPGVFALPGTRRDRPIRRQAALAYQPGSALSHLDGLDLWRYPVPAATLEASPVHITQPPGPTVSQPGLKVHQRQGFHALPRYELRQGLIVVGQEQAIVESWALLPPRDRRAPMILALRDRKTTHTALAEALDLQPNLTGRAEMRTLLGLVAGGCHSELELWGHEQVFSMPGLRHARAQFPIRLEGRRVYLDRYFEQEMVDLEMDGAAYHGLPGQRERDLRRDAALARLGILTVRVSHQRLFTDVAGVRAELLDILRMRRRQLLGTG